MKHRCFGGTDDNSLYAIYHDQEWGIPKFEDTSLFEMLALEGMQAGLRWETILKKRDNYRAAFHGFVIEKVATMSDNDLDVLCNNPGIIRHRTKIFAIRHNAQIFLTIQNKYKSFKEYIWSYVNGDPIIGGWSRKEDVPTQTPISQKISKDLKSKGMMFVGPTIIYAYMQAIGMVKDHLATCWKYEC